jgi:hypothetical protein
MYDEEDRPSIHEELESRAKEAKEKTEQRHQELVVNRDRDFEDMTQKLGASYGLPGAMLTDPNLPHREGATEGQYTAPRHSGTGEWSTPGGGGGPAQTRRSRAKTESAEASA